MKISSVLEKIDEKQLFVPAFQREYVWKRDDAKQLVDSLLREYPTGTMLTWETSHPPELKGDHKYSEQQGAVKLILDGQQRITTLYMLMRGEIPAYYTEEEITHPIMGLYVNLESLELLYHMKKRMDGDPLWQNITDIFQRKVRERHVTRLLEDAEKPVDSSLRDKIDDNIRTIESISERDFPEQVIPPKASIKEAIDIFYKVNASGVSLTDAELALAQISGYWPEARDVFKAKLRQLGEHGFIFKLDFIVYVLLGCMYYMASDMKKLHGMENLKSVDNEEGEVVRLGIKEVWSILESDVIDYVINLLRSKAFVDHTKEINSVYALVPMIIFCFQKRNETIPADQLNRMVKWFYYSQIRQRYISQLPSKLDFDLKIVRDAERPFDQLLAVIEEERRLKISPEEFAGRSILHPLFGLMRWYFKSQGATCLTKGVGLHTNMGEKYKLENDHIFPYSILKKNGYGQDNRINYSYAQELTNRAILTAVANRKKSAQPAYDYLKEIKEKSPEALINQCIPDQEELWSVDNYEEFLKARRKLLAKSLNEFLDGLSVESLEHSGAATVEELIAGGETGEVEFKETLRWGSHDAADIKKAQFIIMKTIAGFSNADGGVLLVGVADDGKVLGLDRDFDSLGGDKDEFELHLGNLIDNTFSKVFRASCVRISFPIVDEVVICRIDISAGDKPYVLETTNKHGQKLEKFYLRNGNQTQELSMADAGDHIRGRFS